MDKDALVDRKFLAVVLEQAGRACGSAIKAAIAPIATRLSSAESRVGALSMLLGRASVDPAKLAEVEEMLHRVQSLDARMKELEARPAIRYEGVYRQGVGYERGTLITHGGGMWHANCATTSRPGTDDTWTLCVKRGKDAR